MLITLLASLSLSIANASYLTISKSGSGSVIAMPPNEGIICSHGCTIASKPFTDLSTVILLAEGGVGSYFSSWGGAACAGQVGPICVVTMTTSKTAIATFAARGTLSACPALPAKDFFTQSPINPEGNITVLESFGVDPPSHTFPNWHMFMAVNPALPMPSVVAPATGKIVGLMRQRASLTAPASTDNYYIRFSTCTQVELLLGVVQNFPMGTFGLSLPQAAMTLPDGSILDFWENLNISVSAGASLGTVNSSKKKLALELYDSRMPTASFVNLGMYRAVHAYLQCPIDYFTNPPQTSLMTKFADQNCHRADQDVAGTLKGNWFKVGSKQGTLEQLHHIAFVDTLRSGVWTPVVSIGNTGILADLGTATPVHNAVGTAFASVSIPGTLSCYPVAGKSLLVLYQDANNVSVKVSTTACGSLGGTTIAAAAPAAGTIYQFRRNN